MVLLQEQKFKTYNNELTHFLREYRRTMQGHAGGMALAPWTHGHESDWRRRAMRLVLLHPSQNCVAFLFQCLPEARQAQSWDQVARMLFGDDVQ